MTVLSGGDKLAAALREMSRGLRGGAELRVGFLEGALYPDGTPVAMVAAIQEFGAPRAGIPPRPFFRRMIAADSGGWAPVVADQLKKTSYDATATLDRLGALIKGQLQQSINDLTVPPLSPVTLMVRQIVGPNGRATFADVVEARRRVAAGESASGVSTKPLIWTAVMLGSVDWSVSRV